MEDPDRHCLHTTAVLFVPQNRLPVIMLCSLHYVQDPLPARHCPHTCHWVAPLSRSFSLHTSVPHLGGCHLPGRITLPALPHTSFHTSLGIWRSGGFFSVPTHCTCTPCTLCHHLHLPPALPDGSHMEGLLLIACWVEFYRFHDFKDFAPQVTHAALLRSLVPAIPSPH